MKDLSLNDITKRIVDAVLIENMINEDNLMLKIKPILRIWMKQVDRPKSIKALQSAIDSERAKNLESKLATKNKYEIKKKKYQEAISNLSKERNYYRNELIKIYGIEGIESIDAQIGLIK